MISPSSGSFGTVNHTQSRSGSAEVALHPPKEGCSEQSSMQGDALQRSSQSAAPNTGSPLQEDMKDLFQDLEKLVKDLLGDAENADSGGSADNADANSADANSADANSPETNSSDAGQQSQPQPHHYHHSTSSTSTSHSTNPKNGTSSTNTTSSTTSTTGTTSFPNPQGNPSADISPGNSSAENSPGNPSTGNSQGNTSTANTPQNGTSSSEQQSSPGDSSGPTGSGLPNGAKNGDAIGGGSTAVQDMTNKGSAWWYNWTPSSGNLQAPNDAQFVPMIWGEKDMTQSNLDAAKSSSSPYLLGFNEPDHPDQANMSVSQAIDAWPKLEATGKILGAPAVANADINNPNSWLNQFMSEAEKKNLRVDFIPLHWYGSSSDVSQDVDQLKNYVQSVEDKYHKPIWVTEMNLWNFSGGPEPTPQQQDQFAKEASTMLNSLPYVQRYAVAQGS